MRCGKGIQKLRILDAGCEIRRQQFILVKVKDSVWVRGGAGGLDHAGPLTHHAQQCNCMSLGQYFLWPIGKHTFYVMTYYQAWPSPLQGLSKRSNGDTI